MKQKFLNKCSKAQLRLICANINASDSEKTLLGKFEKQNKDELIKKLSQFAYERLTNTLKKLEQVPFK